MCVFRQWLWVKAFSQMVHWYGLSPLWVLMWTVRCSWREHAFPQIAHTNLLRLKKRPHSEQPSPLDTKKGRSLAMWIFSWDFRLPESLKLNLWRVKDRRSQTDFPQILQTYLSLLVCILL
uniref:Uncharacterized protein n=1 Tax=Neolamprologus brichardi TaxID=32507 RepID=A0A3Q4IH29_NEOBR